jgi:hypothetical protein
MDRRFILTNLSFGAPKPSSPPTILVTKKALRIDVIKDQGSPIKEYQVSGTRLTDNIVISFEGNSRSFKICDTEDGEYSDRLTLTHLNGTVGKTTIYVKLASTNTVGTSNAKIIHSSRDAANVTLSLTGHVHEIAAEDPYITLSPTSYTFEEELGGTIVPYQYTVIGENLTGDIDIEVAGTDNIQISMQKSLGYSNNLTLRHDGGSVNELIYVKVSDTQLPGDTATITHSSAGCAPQIFTAIWAPCYILITEDLTAFQTDQGTPSTAQTYRLRGIGLTNDITITAPTGFELSTDEVSYTNPITVNNAYNNNIYVRLTGETAGNYSGNISHVSAGATTQDVSVTGSVGQTVQIIGPVFTPEAGIYDEPQNVTLSTTTVPSGGTIYYTTDGSDPTINSTRYTIPIMVSETTTIKVFAHVDGCNDSPISTAVYIIGDITEDVFAWNVEDVAAWNNTDAIKINNILVGE